MGSLQFRANTTNRVKAAQVSERREEAQECGRVAMCCPDAVSGACEQTLKLRHLFQIVDWNKRREQRIVYLFQRIGWRVLYRLLRLRRYRILFYQETSNENDDDREAAKEHSYA